MARLDRVTLNSINNGLKYARNNETVPLMFAILKMAINQVQNTPILNDIETGSMIYIQSLIEYYGLGTFLKAFDQPHIMGPVNFIFSDLDRIRMIEDKESDILKAYKYYLNKYNLSMGYNTTNLTDHEEVAKHLEIKDEYLETLDNPYGIFLSEPFGYCAFASKPFDDFEYLMPFMITEGSYDHEKNPFIKKIVCQ